MDSISQFLNHLLSVNAQGEITFMQGLSALGIAYLGGILSSLTPCVYPMIPITVSVVGGVPVHFASPAAGPAASQAGNRPGLGSPVWRDVLIRAVAYVAGMTVIYSVLGVAAGLTGKVFGSFTNNSTWYFILGIIMTFAALIMLDVIPFDPSAWIDKMKRKFGKPNPAGSLHTQQELSAVGAFVLGASSGFIAAPCTTPVLTAILAYIAKTQSVGLGLFLMIAFSLGLSTLLLVIAAFTGAIQVLPRSGQWMKMVKLVSGLLLLAFAEYLIYRAGQTV